MEISDFAVIGAGIAGASVAAELSRSASVTLIEGEDQPGYHTTGRSAALFTKAYGPAVIRALTRASESFFTNPQSEFIQHPLLHNRKAIFVARRDQSSSLTALHEQLGDAVRPLTDQQIGEYMPLLKPGYAEQGLLDEDASDIDVNALHQHFLRTCKTNGATVISDALIEEIERDGKSWILKSRNETFAANIIVNAAGAWCDEIARLAGVTTIGLVPKRRTGIIIEPPAGVDPSALPMIADVDEAFYLKPEAGKLMVSPADETPSPPCDAQPEPIDVAVCLDRIERAFHLPAPRVLRSWAGLRSFVADKCPVVGFDPDNKGFFWLAGQGGYGIQTAPALARLAAALALGITLPTDVIKEGVSPNDLNSTREGLST